MYFGMCIYETLSCEGRLDTCIIRPSSDSPILVTDRISDVGPKLSRDVDIGPLRFYTEDCGLSVRTASARLGPPMFRSSEHSIEVRIEHLNWPLPDGHAGYYILLLPKGFGGEIRASSGYPEIVFMEDVHQILYSVTVYPDRPSLRITASLDKRAEPPRDSERKTESEVFKHMLPSVHYTPVDNLIKALRHELRNAPSAFVCHSSADKVNARKIAIGLAARGIRPWIDEAEIRTGDSLIEKIESGIQSTTCLLPILTVSSVNSQWCREELKMAMAMQIRSKVKHVLPILMEDCKIPGFLLEKAYADFRNWDEYSDDDRLDRLAADIRDSAQNA
jgi:hypothetical protein